MGVVGVVSIWRWIFVIAIKIITSSFVLVNRHMNRVKMKQQMVQVDLVQLHESDHTCICGLT